MPATLKRDGDELILALKGLDRDAFQHALNAARSVPGKRYDPETKTHRWEWHPQTAQRLVHVVQPQVDAAVEVELREAAHKIAEELSSAVPDVGPEHLEYHFADKLLPWQPPAVKFIAAARAVLLADDMGLGKTIEAIAGLNEYELNQKWIHDRPILLVVPNNVKLKWAREVAKWDHFQRPSVIVGGTKAQRETTLSSLLWGKWVIVNWEMLRLAPQLREIPWAAIIADEVHRAKNRRAKQTQALLGLDAPVKIGLTGSPVMNSPDELWSILAWLRPDEFHPRGAAAGNGQQAYWSFYDSYVEYYNVTGQRGARVVTGVRNPDKLRYVLKDKMVRRTKAVTDIPEKLPPVTLTVDLLPEQRKLYEQAETDLWIEVEQVLQDEEANPAERAAVAKAAEAGDAKALSYLLPHGATRVMRMRQIASTPATLGGEDKSAKLDAAVELILDHPEKPFVVFTVFKATARALVSRLRKRRLRVETYTGDDPSATRDARAQMFQDGDLDVLVCTIAAGGQSIDLFRADTCLFVERDWTPDHNRQAEDRLARQGQQNKVTVVRLEARDTVDEDRITPTNRAKDLIASAIMGRDRQEVT